MLALGNLLVSDRFKSGIPSCRALIFVPRVVYLYVAVKFYCTASCGLLYIMSSKYTSNVLALLTVLARTKCLLRTYLLLQVGAMLVKKSNSLINAQQYLLTFIRRRFSSPRHNQLFIQRGMTVSI